MTGELQIQEIKVLSEVLPNKLPILIEDCSRSEKDAIESGLPVTTRLDTRLDNRVIDLRTVTNQSIFKIRAIIKLFRRIFYLTRMNLLKSNLQNWVLLPKVDHVLLKSATNKKAYLAQSHNFINNNWLLLILKRSSLKLVLFSEPKTPILTDTWPNSLVLRKWPLKTTNSKFW